MGVNRADHEGRKPNASQAADRQILLLVLLINLW